MRPVNYFSAIKGEDISRVAMLCVGHLGAELRVCHGTDAWLET